MADNYFYHMDLPFLWIGVISASFKGSGKAPVLRESLSIYIGLVEIFCVLLKSLTECLRHVEITSIKKVNSIVFVLGFLYAGVVFVLINNTFDWV